jgi:hypothetical protein
MRVVLISLPIGGENDLHDNGRMSVNANLFRNKALRSSAVQWSGQGVSSRLRTGLLLAVWGVFGAVLIHWFLQVRALSWTAMTQGASIQTVEMNNAGAGMGRNLALPAMAYVLGANPQVEEQADDGPQAPSTLNIQLLGVLMNGSGQRAVGVALLAVDGQPARVFRLGQEPMPGWQLARIEAKQVTLKQSAAPSSEQVVALAQPSPGAALPGMPLAPVPDGMLQPDLNPPVGNPEGGGAPAAARRFLLKQP